VTSLPSSPPLRSDRRLRRRCCRPVEGRGSDGLAEEFRLRTHFVAAASRCLPPSTCRRSPLAPPTVALLLAETPQRRPSSRATPSSTPTAPSIASPAFSTPVARGSSSTLMSSDDAVTAPSLPYPFKALSKCTVRSAPASSGDPLDEVAADSVVLVRGGGRRCAERRRWVMCAVVCQVIDTRGPWAQIARVPESPPSQPNKLIGHARASVNTGTAHTAQRLARTCLHGAALQVTSSCG
jgi:hypothetical protein